MTPQLSRQLELNLSALSRGFRQALRHAQKTDPQGTEESSPAWRAVAARQAMLLTMLAAAGPFLHPQPQPQPPPQAQSPPPVPAETSAPAEMEPTVAKDMDDDDAPFNIEASLAMMPADIREDYRQLQEVAKWPTTTYADQRRRERELDRLRNKMETRVQQLKTDTLAKMRAQYQSPPG